jgi:nitrogen-specific signal transduction histidine kinase
LGEGIGLGLYVSKKIIHELKGKIYFESNKGRTEFVIVLPD